MAEKSRVVSGVVYSMSKATICCLRIRRWLRRKRCASVVVVFVRRRVLALCREVVVWCTIWWARSSKTVDWFVCMLVCMLVGCGGG